VQIVPKTISTNYQTLWQASVIPSYVDWGDHGSKPVKAKSLQDPILMEKKWVWCMSVIPVRSGSIIGRSWSKVRVFISKITRDMAQAVEHLWESANSGFSLISFSYPQRAYELSCHLRMNNWPTARCLRADQPLKLHVCLWF
jgi:hypothetical protein